MNPGLSEEAGETARSAIGALTSQPMMLGVLLLNVIIVGFIFFGVQKARDYEVQTRTELTRLLTACLQRGGP